MRIIYKKESYTRLTRCLDVPNSSLLIRWTCRMKVSGGMKKFLTLILIVMALHYWHYQHWKHWNEMKWNEIDYNSVSKRDVLWARLCGGIWPLNFCKPDPPIPSPPPKSRLHLLLFLSCYLPLVVGVVSQRSLFSSGRCYLLLFSLFVFGVRWGCFWRLWTWVWAMPCAWTWIVMTIFCACVGSDLYVMLFGVFSLKNTSWAISANVRVWKLPVLLITMGMICT